MSSDRSETKRALLSFQAHWLDYLLMCGKTHRISLGSTMYLTVHFYFSVLWKFWDYVTLGEIPYAHGSVLRVTKVGFGSVVTWIASDKREPYFSDSANALTNTKEEKTHCKNPKTTSVKRKQWTIATMQCLLIKVKTNGHIFLFGHILLDCLYMPGKSHQICLGNTLSLKVFKAENFFSVLWKFWDYVTLGETPSAKRTKCAKACSGAC